MSAIAAGPRPSPGKGYSLVAHHDAEPSGDITITADAIRDHDALYLCFVIGGKAQIVMPKRTTGRRGDQLWRSTCVEAFVQTQGSNSYVELNFAPSLDWATYHFGGYRDGIREASLTPTLERLGTVFQARIDFSACPAYRAIGWNVGLSAVIEETDGTKSYWALAHAPGPPDFHNRDCWTARLPAPDPT